MRLSRLALWLPNYLKVFGIVAGAVLFTRIAMLALANAREPRLVRVPGLATPIWLRAALGDIAIFQQVFVKREYDMREMPHYAAVQGAYAAEVAAGRQPLIIDCGAHVGLSVRWFLQLFPAARIVAVEPSAANLDVLRRNIAGLENVTLLPGGIWHSRGLLQVENPHAGMTAFRLAQSASPTGDDAGSGAVEGHTVGEIMGRFGAENTLMVKVDIEGGEAALFQDNTAWLDHVGLLIVELHDWLYPWRGTSRNLFRETALRRFDFMMRGENVLCFRHLSAP